MFPFDLLTPVINKVLDFIPDPKAKAEAIAKAQEAMLEHQDKIMAAIAEQNKSQADIDAEEAKNGSLFDKWRDFIGWTCGAAFAWQYVLQPMSVFILTALHRPVILPAIDFSSMSTVLMGMLGLAGMHMYQNVQGDK